MASLSLVVDELGTSGSTLSYFTVTSGLVGHGVLTEVVANHVGLDFDGVPVLSGVDLSDRPDHVWHDDAVAEMGLDGLGLLTVWGVLDRKLQLLHKSVVAGVDPVAEAPSLSGSKHSDHILSGQFEELFELDASVDLFFEWFFCVGSIALLGHGSLKLFFDI